MTEETKVSHPRDDDRNEEIDESPIPDPEQERDPSAEDDPGAD